MHKFDSIVLGSLDIAQSQAMKLSNTELTPEHLFWGLLNNKSSYVSRELKEYKKDL